MSPEEFWSSLDEGDSKDPAIEIQVAGIGVKRVRLQPDITYIGRMAENHIVLDDAQVSRSHARIIKNGDTWTIEDQQSENGIKVNGQKVGQAVITYGDKVEIGSHRLIMVDCNEAETVNVEDNLSKADAPFRADHTIVMMDADAHKNLLNRLKEEKSKSFPELNFKLSMVGKEITKKVVFEKGKKVKEPAKENCVEIQIRYGSWVMYQKVKLDI